MFSRSKYSKYQYYKVIRVFVCMSVCVCLHHSGTAGPIWLNLFLLAPYWSGDGFRLKNFRIRDPVFPEIRKNLYFRVLFDQFGWNFWVILTLNQICFYTNNFWIGYPVYRIRNPVFPEKSGKIWQKSDLTVYHDVIYHFSYSDHGEFIFGTKCAIWRIFSNFLEDFSRYR